MPAHRNPRWTRVEITLLRERGGTDIDGAADYRGWCLTIEWLGCIIDLVIGRARQ